jgi:hypothetical protein
MPVAVPPVVAEAFAINGTRNTIPVPSQIAITPGAASFNDGFPPLTMTSPSAGGVPPAGKDMNGILYMLSAHTAWLQAGGCYTFSSTVVSVAGGYKIGAILQSASTPAVFFLNTVNNNTNNPDTTPTGWITYSPVGGALKLQATTLAAGTVSDLALGLGVGFLDLDPSSGATNLTGIATTNVTDGQFLVITNVNASNTVTLKAFDIGSASSARFRAPADFTLLQYSSVTFRFSAAVGMWTLA